MGWKARKESILNIRKHYEDGFIVTEFEKGIDGAIVYDVTVDEASSFDLLKSLYDLVDHLTQAQRDFYYRHSDGLIEMEFELTSQLSSVTKRLDKIESRLNELLGENQ